MIATIPKCPNCGGTIKPADCSGEEFKSTESFIVECEGTCLKCGHEIIWTVYYTFTGIGEICDCSKEILNE